MEKTRVKKGEKYWFIITDGCDGIDVKCSYDDYLRPDYVLFELGNYFTDRDSAKSMAKKLRAVLKDADVIEMPSEEDASFESAYLLGLSGHDDGDRRAEAYLDGFADCLHWLKSKIK